MLYYVPLESYKSRYTHQLSAANWGWMERNWKEAGVSYVRINSSILANRQDIETGVVLDCFQRSRYAMGQIITLLEYIESGYITSEDTIYFEDFFHPGIEAIPYCCHLKGIKPKVYAYWWAQSVDKFDFTYAMRSWMKYLETSQLCWLDGIFVACPSMKELIVEELADSVGDGVLPFDDDKIHVVGLPFDSAEVLRRCPSWHWSQVTYGRELADTPKRKNQVVFSSRWDTEKNPDFFMEVARVVATKHPDTTFVVCTGSWQLRSNDQKLLDMAANWQGPPGRFQICSNLSKEDYYRILCESKIVFNCADQDWVSFTLLEASVCGCYPVYPRFRSFPETLDGKLGQNYLYTHKNLNSAAAAIEHILSIHNEHLWTPLAIANRSWIHRRFDDTWKRMLTTMGIECGWANLKSPFDNAWW